MNHPFDLDISALENIEFSFAEELNEAAAEIVAGGGHIQCISAPCPGSEAGGSTGYPSFEFPRIKFSGRKESPTKEPPTYTTLAVGEEGGEVTTLAGIVLDLLKSDWEKVDKGQGKSISIRLETRNQKNLKYCQ